MARLHKVTVEEVRALRAASDMPVPECAKVLREKAKDSYIEELENENDRLRKLMKNALTYIEYHGCGIEEPYIGLTGNNPFCDMCQHFDTDCCAYVIRQDAKELGIEAE